MIALTSLVTVGSRARQTACFLATRWPERPPDEQRNLSLVVSLSKAEDVEKARVSVTKPTREWDRPAIHADSERSLLCI
jgi:hypothetical protein